MQHRTHLIFLAKKISNGSRRSRLFIGQNAKSSKTGENTLSSNTYNSSSESCLLPPAGRAQVQLLHHRLIGPAGLGQARGPPNPLEKVVPLCQLSSSLSNPGPGHGPSLLQANWPQKYSDSRVILYLGGSGEHCQLQ